MAILDVTNYTLHIVIFDSKEMLGVLDLRSVGYFRVKYTRYDRKKENICNKYNSVFVPGTLGILPDTYLVPVSYAMGQEIDISMPYEYTWGLSMEQRGTTELTIYTTFIHIKTSLTAYITSQCMVG